MASTRSFTLQRIGQTAYGAQTMRGGVTGGIRVVGLPELIAKLKLVGQVAQRDLGLILYRGAQTSKTAAQAAAPVKTGVLKRGHRLEKAGPYTWNLVVDTEEAGRSYAGYQEFGYHDRGGNWHEGRGFVRAGVAEGNAQVQGELVALARKLEML